MQGKYFCALNISSKLLLWNKVDIFVTFNKIVKGGGQVFRGRGFLTADWRRFPQIFTTKTQEGRRMARDFPKGSFQCLSFQERIAWQDVPRSMQDACAPRSHSARAVWANLIDRTAAA
ncbi:MAG: hypothetical protein D4R65_10500 [Verrucomicrobiaceae bacterium]|nr:MAG: hypothetical protein D4R65_10500 [Verrucomicrobiaceae bacterium]